MQLESCCHFLREETWLDTVDRFRSAEVAGSTAARRMMSSGRKLGLPLARYAIGIVLPFFKRRNLVGYRGPIPICRSGGINGGSQNDVVWTQIGAAVGKICNWNRVAIF